MSQAKAGRSGRLQSATELLVIYGIAFLILAVVITVLYSVFASPSSKIYNTCNFAGGVTCGEIILGTNSVTSNTAIVVLLSNAGTSYLKSPHILVSVKGTNSTSFACSPNYVRAGGSILCIINLTTKSNVAETMTGTLYFSAQNCAFSNPGSCQQTANQIYAGSFSATSQYLSPTLGIGITLTAANADPPTNNQKDQLIATVTLFGNPLRGITVNFSSNTPSVYQVSPKYASTNATGKALSYIWGATPGLVRVFANFSNTISANVLLLFGGQSMVATALSVRNPTYAIVNSIDPIGSKGTYTVNAAFSGSSGNYINAAPGNQYGLYLCAAAEGENVGNAMQLTGLSYSPPDVYNASPGLDVAAIGHQSFNGCSAHTTYGGLASVEVGLNGVSGYQFYPAAQGSSRLTYTVSTPRSFVVIMAACAAFSCYGFKLPSNCTAAAGSARPITADGNESVHVAVCQNQAAGTYNAYLVGGQNNTLGAYVFPPQASNTITITSSTTSTTTTVSTTTIPYYSYTNFTAQGLTAGGMFSATYASQALSANVISKNGILQQPLLSFTAAPGNYQFSPAAFNFNGLGYLPYLVKYNSGGQSYNIILINSSVAVPAGVSASVYYRAGFPVNSPISNLPAVIGCGGSGTIYNYYTGTSQTCLNLPSSAVLNAVFVGFGSTANATIDNYTMAGLVDTWYGSSSVEAAVVNCAPSASSPPCLIEADINAAGSVLNVTTTD